MTKNPGIYHGLLIFLVTLLAPAAYGQVCQEWKNAEHIGELQVQVKEASGLAASRKFAGRLYHINDSGNQGAFYITNLDGKGTTTISIVGPKPVDTEALSLGSCGPARSCLYIGDIGDNDRRRRQIEIVLVEEMQTFPASVQPRQRLRLQYPDGPHDAESIAVHPNGTIFLLTKEQPARLYKALPGLPVQTLVPVTTVDTAGFSPTDMAISDDGTRLLVLTYLYAMELGIDFAHPATPRFRQRIKIQPLQQEESIAYLPGSNAFIYTTERANLPAWIMRVECGKGN